MYHLHKPFMTADGNLPKYYYRFIPAGISCESFEVIYKENLKYAIITCL